MDKVEKREIAKRVLNSLGSVYGQLEGTNVRADMLSLGYSEKESDEIQGNINNMLKDLEDYLPGIEMEALEES